MCLKKREQSGPGETIWPARQNGPRPARAKNPGQLTTLSLSPCWRVGPLPRQLIFNLSNEETHSTKRSSFSVSCIASLLDSWRFKTPINEPFCPINIPLDPLYFPPNGAQGEPPGCSQSTSPSRGSSRRLSTIPVDSGIPLTSICLHSISLDLAHLPDILVCFIPPQVEPSIVNCTLPSAGRATASYSRSWRRPRRLLLRHRPLPDHALR